MKVALELVAGYAWPLPALADRVRERVRAAARDGVGLAVEHIDVRVVDLMESDTGDGPDTGERSTS
ncbi:hypothetical protein [Streptomyces rimosus]